MCRVIVEVGDRCKADPEEEGVFLFGVITKIEDGCAWSDLLPPTAPYHKDGFAGDLPTRNHDGVWIFDAF